MSDSGKSQPNQPDVVPIFVDGGDRPRAERAAKPAAPKPEPSAPPETKDARHRDGECVPNVPDIGPALVERADEPPAAKADSRTDAETAAGLPVPAWLRWGYFAATLFLAALFGLFLFSQTISSIALAGTLPTWAQYALLVPLAFCGLVVLGVACSLVWSWLRLRTVRQVSLAAVEELRRRAESRKDGLEHFQEARRKLEKYMADYPLAGREAGRLQAAGLSADDIERLFGERDYLAGRSTDSKGWLDEFRAQFQARLDQAAARRVSSWAIKAAGCVMASPLPLLDAVLILGIALKMIRDLCVIYNVRTGGTATLVLLARAIRNAFLAGVAEDAAEKAGEILGEEMSALLGDTAMGTVSSSFARIVAPKLGEGAINGLFMRRLGKATIRMLQPLR